MDMNCGKLKKYAFRVTKNRNMASARVRVPGGSLNAKVLGQVQHIAETYGNGEIHLTIRQGFEIMGIPFEKVEEVKKALQPIIDELDINQSERGAGFEASGTRNVMACVGNRVCPFGNYDTTALAKRIEKAIFPNDLHVKVALTGCPNDCDKIRMHDFGVMGMTEPQFDASRCVSCGMCLVNCPFGAIVDKGQIFQLIQSIKRGDEVIAIVAPAFVNQFPNMTPAKLREAMKRLGFANTAEVAIGADLCTIDEAHDFLEEVPSKHPFMGTSCCPAWSVMAKKNFPKFADCISMTMTPMVLTARLLKQDHPAARICFVGPCAAKKLEASRHSVRSEVDFVLTFEELMGMFEAKQINFDDLPDDPNDNFNNASADGRGFAVSGGVAQAVVNVIKKEDPTREVKVVSAQGLAECKKMMQLAAAGKYNGYLLEGMACPGGCIAGAGTLADPARSAMMLNKYKAQATMKTAADTPYKDTLDKLKY